jgi:hypothetical protein
MTESIEEITGYFNSFSGSKSQFIGGSLKFFSI